MSTIAPVNAVTQAFIDDLNANFASLDAAQVTTLAALKATPAAAPAVVSVGYKTTPGDGWGGLFALDSTDTTTAGDDALVVVDEQSRRWKRIYDGPLDPRWFGALTSATDNSAAFQAALNAAAAAGGNVVCPIGRWKLTAQIVVPRNVIMHGLGDTALTWPEGIAGGAILEINWGSGSGASDDPTKAAVQLRRGAGIDNMAFDYPAQVATMETPIEYGASVIVKDDDSIVCLHQKIRDCYFHKSYVCIDARGSIIGMSVGDLTITGNEGAFLRSFLKIDSLCDWCDIRNNRFNAGFISENTLVGGVWTGLVGWAAYNGIVLDLGGCDWFQAFNVQSWGYKTGAYIHGRSGYSGAGPYSLNGCQFDAAYEAVVLDGAIALPVRIMGCHFSAENLAETDGDRVQGACIMNAPGLDIESTGGLIVTDCTAHGWLNQFVWLANYIGEINNVMVKDNIAVNTRFALGDGIAIGEGNNIQVVNNTMLNFLSAVDIDGASTNVVNENNQS